MANAVGFVDFERRGELHLCMAFLQWLFNVVKFPEDLNRDGKMVRVMLTPTHRRWMIVMVLILVSATAQMVSAETAQTWYFTGDGKPTDAPTANDGLDHAKNNLMHKGSGSDTGSYFDLNSTKVAWFYADTGAECGLGFGENPWEAHIRTEKIEDDEIGHNLTVEICKLENNTGNITILASHTQQLTTTEYTKHLWNMTCEDVGDDQEFNTGDWLAVRLSWDCSTDELRIHYKNTTGQDSYITSPSSDPGYPVPELPTLALFSVGLLIIAGCAYMGRRAE